MKIPLMRNYQGDLFFATENVPLWRGQGGGFFMVHYFKTSSNF